LNGSNGFRFDGLNGPDNAGTSVASAGDINGDGFADVVVSARLAGPLFSSPAGESYVIFGGESGFSSTLNASALDGTNGFRLPGIANQDASGKFVSSAGDINGDGIDDLMIGADYAEPDVANTNVGEVYVIFGRAEFTDVVTNGAITVNINPVNDAPTGSGLPADLSFTEDTSGNVDLSAFSVADIDSASVTVTLTASAGTFGVPADGMSAGVVETLVSATVITLIGSPADINTYLDTASNITYTPAQDVNGDDVATISVTANDGDGSGDVALGTVNVDVTAANDATLLARTWTMRWQT